MLELCLIVEGRFLFLIVQSKWFKVRLYEYFHEFLHILQFNLVILYQEGRERK